MEFKSFQNVFLFRIGLLLLTTFLCAQQLFSSGFILNILVLFGLIVFQVILLRTYYEKTQKQTLDFLEGIKNGDFSTQYNTEVEDEYQARLNKSFNQVLNRIKELRSTKDGEHQYLKNIVQHVGIGLITFDGSGKIQIMNTAAKKLLKVGMVEHLDELEPLSEKMVETFKKLKTGGSDLVRLTLASETIQLSVYAIELALKDKPFKLVSIQDIRPELEEREMEAWRNLVRVLTHEIMNSATPISSLAATIGSDLTPRIKNNETNIALDDLEDIHLAISTIERRSAGLIKFVQEFRNLAHPPTPEMAPVLVQEMLEAVERLLRKEAEDKEVETEIHVEPDDIEIMVDRALIEQVLINLVKNAIQSFDEDNVNRKLTIKSYYEDGHRPVIAVIDNGPGIEEEALEKIFVPFFTTKKTGSGIGLSLSREIMRKHHGTISVNSEVDSGTEFYLKF